MESLGNLLTAAADNQDLEAASRELQEFVEQDIVAGWPLPEVRYGDLEVWGPGYRARGQRSGSVLGKRRCGYPAGIIGNCPQGLPRRRSGLIAFAKNFFRLLVFESP